MAYSHKSLLLVTNVGEEITMFAVLNDNQSVVGRVDYSEEAENISDRNRETERLRKRVRVTMRLRD